MDTIINILDMITGRLSNGDTISGLDIILFKEAKFRFNTIDGWYCNNIDDNSTLICYIHYNKIKYIIEYNLIKDRIETLLRTINNNRYNISIDIYKYVWYYNDNNITSIELDESNNINNIVKDGLVDNNILIDPRSNTNHLDSNYQDRLYYILSKYIYQTSLYKANYVKSSIFVTDKSTNL